MAGAAALLAAEWFGSTVIEKLTNIVIDAIKEKCHQLESIRSLLDNLNINLPLVRKLVDIAASKLTLDPVLSDWLKQLKDVIYDADDLLDELDYEKLQLEVSTSAFSRSNSINKIFFSDHFITRLKSLVEKLDKLATRVVCFIELLKLDDHKNKDMINERNESTSLMNDDEKDKFVGRDKEKDMILDILLASHTISSKKKQKAESSRSRTYMTKQLVVLPIVGIGGVGKTTLAKVIYNDQRVQDHFDLKAWVYVSNSYDTRKIMFEIINLFAHVDDIEYSDSLEKMVRKLKMITSSKTFLLVLDDVSKQFCKQWETIGNALRQWENGSAVLITTQTIEVVENIGSIGPITLDVLNDTDYWILFKYHAFGENILEQGKRKILEKIGEEISRKLKGLPLAARALGNLLKTRLDENYWSAVLRSEWWEHKNVADEILPSLALSYQHLNTNQKQCFAYCSIFPNNYLFEKHHIVEMWIAQGYIQSSDVRRAEDIGNECFEELTRKSFFLHTWNDRYIMHELMLKLAKFVAKDECFIMEDGSTKPPETVCHLTIKTDMSPSVAYIACRYKKLRTLLVFGDWNNFMVNKISYEIFKELKHLRVLDLSYAFPKGLNLADEIGDLLHIRYLDMRGNLVVSLPHAICNLFHLQVLNLEGCPIASLPNEIDNLISLRHLYADVIVLDMILSIGKLTNLQELASFTADKKSGHKITELKELNQLHGSLCIAGLENVQSKEEALVSNITEKKYLKYLSMCSSNSDPQREEEVFEGLQPHPNLQQLDIKGYIGFILPFWMLEIQCLNNLQVVSLVNCMKLRNLPPLGQLPYLKSLSLERLWSIIHINDEFYGNLNEAFPCLEVLKFKQLEKLTEWEECSARHRSTCFSSLHHLSISFCINLKKFPNFTFFPSLKIFQVDDCRCLETSLESIHSLTDLMTISIKSSYQTATSLTLSNCTALEYLSLSGCFHLRSLGCLQSLVNLKTVTILHCYLLGKTSPLNNLDSWLELPSVTHLTMDSSLLMKDGSIIISSLPSLQTLTICNIWNDYFSSEQEKWFEQLFSLQVLEFSYCLSLLQLPVSLVNLQLRKITIDNCISIGSLPDSGLPDSLEALHIYYCPRLLESCEKERGPDWPKIAHIPFINFDYKTIQGI